MKAFINSLGNWNRRPYISFAILENVKRLLGVDLRNQYYDPSNTQWYCELCMYMRKWFGGVDWFLEHGDYFDKQIVVYESRQTNVTTWFNF